MSRVRRNWTAEEDAHLRKLVNNEIENSRPLLWRALAKKVPGRTNKDCRKRWWNSLANSTARGPWSQAENKRLIKAVSEHGTNWNEVAHIVGTRYADQCSSHWSQVLDLDINHCDWTAEEDEKLLHAVLSHGTTWSTIATSHTPKRTTLALKNRYYALRLRHQNAGNHKEPVSAKAPSSPSIKVASRIKSKNGQDDRSNGNGDTEDEEGDEEVDEDGEHREEDDGNEEEEGNWAMVEYGDSIFPLIPNCTSLIPHDLSANKAASSSSPNTVEIPEMWTGYTGAPKESIYQWMNAAMNDQTMYMNADTQLYPGERVLYANQDTSGLDMNADTMNIDFDNLQGSLFPEYKSSNNGNSIMSVNSITPLDTSLPCDDIAGLSPESLKDTNLLPVEDGGINTTAQASSYHISITMACKSDQLGDVMTWVLTNGLACNVKINSQA
ncbi:hypothetical protein TMatcc_001286 [Talaromyces marneffei ATCC 18224]|uniref:uncharacterized protein n=1 Tax=Talaromyces marneffei TaxID=37727 RepID=UPI0012A838BF|nr:uncharacterized protein EYB26_007476 [Talaromyces marneffei]KAE8551342.1 hypothetical protein EYB25_005227 [Talaromyces marneffei]QGA19782.1 hypothetical protein EYB26_007476 [Talaromyces marneffei]